MKEIYVVVTFYLRKVIAVRSVGIPGYCYAKAWLATLSKCPLTLAISGLGKRDDILSADPQGGYYSNYYCIN